MPNTTRADALLADLPRAGRGRLKVFLGAAPGVGKTYAMLQAAHTQLRQGVSLLAGVVETHGRAETEALLNGLPQQPLLRAEYRGVQLEEMDLDGLLSAHVQLVLVDELAHSNAPGSRHTKRWQDVQELLAAGIDVYTTVNVQHLESLNDQVRGITGVQVRETVPDWIVQEAYELLLIDLPPRELLERLREGKVYVPEQARAAIDAFFSQTNLNALRELAMQTAAVYVDDELDKGYRQLGQSAPALRGRLVVGIDGDEQAERLVRHASRVAERRHLPWSLVHVDNGRPRDEQSRLRLQSAQLLAERLGGEVVLLRAGEVAKTLIQHARERRASLLLVGQSRLRWHRRLLGGGLAARLLRDAHGLEINVLDHEQSSAPVARHGSHSASWFDYALAVPLQLPQSFISPKSFAFDRAQQQWLEQRGPLRVGVYVGDYAPLDITGERNRYQGISADYLGLVRDTLGVNVSVSGFSQRDQAVAALLSGKIDLLTSASGYERGVEGLIFSADYMADRSVVVGRASDVSGTENGDQKKIGFLEGHVEWQRQSPMRAICSTLLCVVPSLALRF